MTVDGWGKKSWPGFLAGTVTAGSALGGGLPAAVAEAAAGGGGWGLGSSLIVMSGLRAPGNELAD